MSIKSELNKTAEYLRRTRKAILGRGGEISETAGLKDLPDAIINIPADTSLAFQTDEETAYEKVVPSGAEEYALLKSVGGMSYRDEEYNILRHTKVTAFESEGANLVKMVNGTHVLNDYYSAHLNNGHMRIDRKGYTSALSLSSTLLRKYTEVFLPAGTYSLVFYNVIVEKITTTGLYLVKSNGEQIINGKGIAEGVNNIFTLDSDDTVSWGIYMYESNANTEEGYFEADVMLNASENALPYKPYVGKIDTYTIPEAMQSLEGYGLGVDGYGSNKIYFSGKKYIRECYPYIILGNEDWNKHASLPIFYCISLFNRPSNSTNRCLCNAYEGTVKWWAQIANGQITNNVTSYSGVAIHDSRFSTVEEWKAHLAELYANGNPVTVIYVADEPTETDISDILTEDNFLKVEGGGVIRAVNEHKQDAPSTIKYTVKVGS